MIRPRKQVGTDTAISIADLRNLARHSVPSAVFDYIDGAAMDEVTAGWNMDSFSDYSFRPTYMKDVSEVDLSVNLFGQTLDLPLLLAPTGLTRIVHHEGEVAVARALADRHIPYVLSTMATCGFADVEDASGGPVWFQLAPWKDRGFAHDLMGRLAEVGCDTLVFTIDAPVAGVRERDLRNGFTIPPSITWRTLVDGARYPRWWVRFLNGPPLTFANLGQVLSKGASISEYVLQQYDPSYTWDDLASLRAHWEGRFVVKGILTEYDALQAMSSGADALVVSNHGGRQLDYARSTLEALPEVVDAVGDAIPVLIDSGIRRGGDLVKAIALGATATMIGRPYLYGLAAGGTEGVRRAIDILTEELTNVLRLLGVTSPTELGAHHLERVPAERCPHSAGAG